MFCDLVGSTPLAETLDPEDLRDVILGYQQACARAVERFGGHVAKYIGDGLLVYFGYPRAHEDDPQRAVHAGLGILTEVAALNFDLCDAHDVALHVRIGIHTGLVVAGEMGAGSTREELAIVGETPNIAARIESVADTDTVAISNTTRALVEGVFETTPTESRTLKGVSRDVSVHTVVRAIGLHKRLDDGRAGTARTMVGRSHELIRLTDLWTLVSGGHGAVAHISGEAGIGKSRLLQALRDRLADDVGSLRVLQCSAYHESTALYPVIEHLNESLGSGSLGSGGASRGRTAIDNLDTVVGATGLDPHEATPLLATLLSLSSAADRGGQPLSPLDARAATLRVLETLLVTDPAQHPLLLVVEDLHWADPTTVELLERIVRLVRSRPVLAVFTFRSDFTPPWSDAGRIVDLPLRPLTADEVTSMVAAAGTTVVAESVVARVVDAADGVPLFVQEMLKMLDDASAATGADNMVDGDARIAVPPTLRGLLTERLDRLPDLRDVIDVVAVVGRDVSRELLEGIGGAAGSDVDAALAALVAQEVLRPIDDASSRYEFSHALLQEAAYDSVLRKRRQTLHRRVAGVLAEQFPARAEREPEVVAQHLVAGGDPASSIPHWHAAGLLALDRAAYLEAAHHFDRGIAAIEVSNAADDITRAEFFTDLGASLQAGRGYAAPRVDGAYAEARVACSRAGRRDRLVSVIRGQWLFHLLRAEYAAAFDLAGEMLGFADGQEREESRAEGFLLRGMVHMYRGDLEPAREDFENAIEHYQPPAGPDQVYEAQGDTGVMALAYLAPVLYNLGFVDRARARSDESLVLADHVGGPVTRAQAWGMRALLLLGRGDPEVMEWAERARAHSVERNITYWKNLSELTVGWLRGRTGDLHAGIDQMETALANYLEGGARLGLPLFRSLLAELRFRAGDHRQALQELSDGEAFMAETGELYAACRLFLAKGRVLMDRDDPDTAGAGEAFAAALDEARRQRARLLELRAAAYLTEHQDALGVPRTEVAALIELCDWFGPQSTLAEVTTARAVLGRRHAQR